MTRKFRGCRAAGPGSASCQFAVVLGGSGDGARTQN